MRRALTCLYLSLGTSQVDRRLSAVETDHLVVSAVSVVSTELPAVGVAVTDKRDDANGDAISCAIVPDSTPLDASQ